jgi:PAS domain S-box-containing protein
VARLKEDAAVGLTGSAPGEDQFLAAVLDRFVQPVWVVDHDGVVRFANPAAVAALGFEDLAELQGRPAHMTVHYKRPDGSPYPIEECPITLTRLEGKTIEVAEDHWIRKDGSFVLVSYSSAPIETPAGRAAVVAFTDVEQRRRMERAIHQRDVAEARSAELSAARRRIIEAADSARRRVTRDLHDGAQQRFVNAVINLQLARARLTSDPERAAELLELGLEQARAGIADLRDLAAGIHPAILTNRGLDAAVEALADGLPVQVDVRAELPERLPEAVEASAYFFISEALTNVVKHAHAGRASVRLVADADRVVIEITDDGDGGVTLDGTRGSGLGGLADRIAALDGTIAVSSPPGRGTFLHADVPLGSSAPPAGASGAGANLTRLRVRAGLSIDALADCAGISPALLSELEAGAGDARLETLYALATELGVPLSDLIPPTAPGPVRVVRAVEGPTLEGEAVIGRLLSRFDGRDLTGELIALRLKPGVRQVSRPHPAGVREHLIVHRGRARVGSAASSFELGPGDFAEYSGSVTHLYEAQGGEAEAILLMITRRPGQTPE